MKKKNRNKKERFELTELMMARADRDRTFIGSMTREMENGKEVLRAKVIVNEGMMISAPMDSLEALYHAMDTICILKLDHGLHNGDPSAVEKYWLGDILLN